MDGDHASSPYVPLVNQAAIDFTKAHEMAVPYLYQDSLGYITVGVGCNVDESAKKAHDLGMFWREADGRLGNRRASLEDIQQAYDKIRAFPKGYKASFYDPANKDHFLPIFMRDEDMAHHLRRILLRSEQELKRKIPHFDRFPYTARRALLDMQYNMGDQNFNDRKWPNFYRALAAQDWQEVARRSNRYQISHERNQAIYKMFLEVDREGKIGC